MKRDHPEIDNSENTPIKRAKITKTLTALLIEVSAGNYEDFRTWLVQTDCQSLNLIDGLANAVNLSHLGMALQGTAVKHVNLSGNNIGDVSAKDFGLALKGTYVTHVNLSNNRISGSGAKNFGQALKNTSITHVNLKWNNIGPYAKKLGKALQGTAVTHLNLHGNCIGYVGAGDLVKALKGTTVTHLNLRSNSIGFINKDFITDLKNTVVTHVNLRENWIGDLGTIELLKSLAGSNVTSLNLCENLIKNYTAPEIAALIEKTNLFKLKLSFTDPAITVALRNNQARLHLAPYEFARSHYFDITKKQKLLGEYYPALTNTSTSQEQIIFAASTLSQVPTRVAKHILTFLPLMNKNKVKNIFTAASTGKLTFSKDKQSMDECQQKTIMLACR